MHQLFANEDGVWISLLAIREGNKHSYQKQKKDVQFSRVGTTYARGGMTRKLVQEGPHPD